MPCAIRAPPRRVASLKNVTVGFVVIRCPTILNGLLKRSLRGVKALGPERRGNLGKCGERTETTLLVDIGYEKVRNCLAMVIRDMTTVLSIGNCPSDPFLLSCSKEFTDSRAEPA